MATNPILHAQTKHIKLDYHFVREQVKLGTHNVQFIPLVDQRADFLTKGLYKPHFHVLCSKLVTPRLPSLLGGLLV